jgi:hypothetical protein
MRPQIEGEYASDQGVVRIAHNRNAYRTIYSRTGSVPNLPAFSSEYRIEIGDELIGRAQFGEGRLAGEFRSAALGDPAWNNGVMSFPNASLKTPPIFGFFNATLREDGSFDVVIEQWGGSLGAARPKREIGFNTFEPETERIETTWVRRV